MEQLPKIVRERLPAQARLETHPDPDLLTGFAENSLNGGERERMLQHLAICADCREILSFAQPQPELEYAFAAASHRPPVLWYRRPQFRWLAVAACVAVAGSVAVLQYQARMSRLPAPAPILAAKTQEKKSLDELTSSSLDDKLPEAKQQATASQLEAELQAVPEERMKKEGMKKEAARESAKARPAQKNSPALPAITEPRFMAAIPPAPGAAIGGTVGSLARSAPGRVAAGTADKEKSQNEQALGSVTESVQVTAAAPAVSTETGAAGAAVANNAPTYQAQGMRNRNAFAKVSQNAIAPRWALSSDGTMLLRSFDSGSTWQTIAVAPNVIFRSVGAVGADVWAGGSGGALYHSADAGQHWVQVRPLANGQLLSSDIVRIEFTDPAHGKLATADGASWTTADGGRSWQRP